MINRSIDQSITVTSGPGGKPLFDGLLSKSAKAALEDYKKKEAVVVGGMDSLAKENSVAARDQLKAVSLK